MQGKLEPSQNVADENRERLLAELFDSREYEPIGKTASAMAHDFNNLMQAILSYSYVVNTDDVSQQERNDSIEEIRRAADRAGSLAQQLLLLRRLRKRATTPFDLSDRVRNAFQVANRLLKKEIKAEFIPDEKPCLVIGDPEQIEQVFMNVFFNALEAVGNEGRITIRTQNVMLDLDWLSRCPWITPGPHVLLCVKDSGIGMSREVQSRIFDPFFTTRIPSAGRGLGLTFVDAIVKQHKGFIIPESVPGEGTTFSVYLPASTDPCLI